MGSTNPSAALAAMAASAAEPPRARICAPACDASGWLVATMPSRLMTIERAWERSAACAAVSPTSSPISSPKCRAEIGGRYNMRRIVTRPWAAVIAQKSLPFARQAAGPASVGSTMTASPPAGRDVGYAAYTPGVLQFYDLLVHGVSNRWAWRCPTTSLTALYEQRLADPHLDVGVGTGYFLDRARLSVQRPRITLLDPNQHCLDAAARRIARYQPQCVLADALEPLPAIGPFASIGLLYVLHCLPGTMAAKAVIFDRLKPLLATGGTLFGATIVDDGVGANGAARALMAFYNWKGIFSNRSDTQRNLEAELRRRFERVETTRRGCVVLFAAG